jgi:ABC-2 type transport system permease protein
MAPIFDTLASEFAGKVVYMSFVIPVTAVLAFLLQPTLKLTTSGVLFFVPALALAWVLRFFWGYAMSLLAFWLTRADALLAFQDSLTFLLAGQIAPVDLLPGVLQTLALWLPFRYMLGFPVEILMGQLTPSEVLFGFAVQLFWVCVSLALSLSIWQRGLRRYTAVGG